MTQPRVAWRKARLGEVCTVLPGYAFKSTDWQDHGLPVIRIKNIQPDRTVETRDVAYLPESILTPKLEKFLLKDGDILIAMTGATAGKVGRPRSEGIMLLNQRVARIKPLGADEQFIWSVVSSDEYQARFFRLADGAAQPNMSAAQIESVEILLPPPIIQCKIGSILCAYDDLIENNLQRIKILEEMAEVLYREWFVKFRFPGHEKARMVDSRLGKIPKGWEVRNLGELCELRKDKYRDDQHSELPLLDLAKMLQRTLAVGEMGSPEELSTSRILFDEDDILFGSIRPYLHKVALAPCLGVTNVSVLVIRPAKAGLRALLTVLLCSEDAIRWADQHSTGTKMPVIKWEIFQEMPVLMPEPTVVQRFQEIVQPKLQTINLASSRNRNLRRTRDLILPKLISGELDVAELDIAVPEGA